MILYAFEILLLFVFSLATFFVFRFLVNSPAFSRFVEGSKPDYGIEIESQTDAKEDARKIAEKLRSERRRGGQRD